MKKLLMGLMVVGSAIGLQGMDDPASKIRGTTEKLYVSVKNKLPGGKFRLVTIGNEGFIVGGKGINGTIKGSFPRGVSYPSNKYGDSVLVSTPDSVEQFFWRLDKGKVKAYHHSTESNKSTPITMSAKAKKSRDEPDGLELAITIEKTGVLAQVKELFE